jgi:hypothetical protein
MRRDFGKSSNGRDWLLDEPHNNGNVDGKKR